KSTQPDWLSALANQLLRLHAERSGDLPDSQISQVVAWSEWEQLVPMTIMSQLWVFVLAGHNLVAVALEKPSHITSTNRRQGEPFSFPIYAQCRPLRSARA